MCECGLLNTAEKEVEIVQYVEDIIDIKRLVEAELLERTGAVHIMFWLDQVLDSGMDAILNRLQKLPRHLAGISIAEYVTLLRLEH